MRVWEIRGGFGLEHLVVGERPDPTPGPGEVLVRVGACSLNRRDLMTVMGEYNPRQPLPLVPLSDGAGRIEALGEGVSGLAVGERVCGLFCQGYQGGAPTRAKLRQTLGGPLGGMLAELVVLPADGVARVPEHLSDEEAATLPCAALTAWTALVEEGGLQAGESVLVLGTGGVSLFALQLAKLAGARVFVTSSSDEKLARARALGADEGINYRSDPKWGDTARKLAGEGVDHVVEVGGAGTLSQSLKAVRTGGTVHLIGVLGGAVNDLNLVPLFMGHRRLQGVFVGHGDAFAALTRAVAQHRLRPVIDRTFAFDETKEALAHMQGERHFGKICIRVSGA